MPRLACVVLGCLLAAGSAQAESKPKVVVLNLAPSDPSLKQLADSLSEQVLTELGRTRRVDTLGQSDMTAVLGLERQKQLLGCGELATSCLAEFSAALGAPWLVSGSIARLGKAVRIDLKLIRTSDGTAVYRDGRSTHDESEVFEVVSSMVKDMASKVEFGPSSGAVAATVDAPAAQGPLPWVVVGSGAAVVAVGAYFCASASSQWKNLNDSVWKQRTSWVVVKQTGDSFNGNVIAGPLLVGVGIAAAAGGLAWYFLGRPNDGGSKVAIGSAGNGVWVGGSF
jgi:TolB-like protein